MEEKAKETKKVLAEGPRTKEIKNRLIETIEQATNNVSIDYNEIRQVRDQNRLGLKYALLLFLDEIFENTMQAFGEEIAEAYKMDEKGATLCKGLLAVVAEQTSEQNIELVKNAFLYISEKAIKYSYSIQDICLLICLLLRGKGQCNLNKYLTRWMHKNLTIDNKKIDRTELHLCNVIALMRNKYDKMCSKKNTVPDSYAIVLKQQQDSINKLEQIIRAINNDNADDKYNDVFKNYIVLNGHDRTLTGHRKNGAQVYKFPRTKYTEICAKMNTTGEFTEYCSCGKAKQFKTLAKKYIEYFVDLCARSIYNPADYDGVPRYASYCESAFEAAFENTERAWAIREGNRYKKITFDSLLRSKSASNKKKIDARNIVYRIAFVLQLKPDRFFEFYKRVLPEIPYNNKNDIEGYIYTYAMFSSPSLETVKRIKNEFVNANTIKGLNTSQSPVVKPTQSLYDIVRGMAEKACLANKALEAAEAKAISPDDKNVADAKEKVIGIEQGFVNWLVDEQKDLTQPSRSANNTYIKLVLINLLFRAADRSEQLYTYFSNNEYYDDKKIRRSFKDSEVVNFQSLSLNDTIHDLWDVNVDDLNANLTYIGSLANTPDMKTAIQEYRRDMECFLKKYDLLTNTDWQSIEDDQLYMPAGIIYAGNDLLVVDRNAYNDRRCKQLKKNEQRINLIRQNQCSATKAEIMFMLFLILQRIFSETSNKTASEIVGEFDGKAREILTSAHMSYNRAAVWEYEILTALLYSNMQKESAIDIYIDLMDNL